MDGARSPLSFGWRGSSRAFLEPTKWLKNATSSPPRKASRGECLLIFFGEKERGAYPGRRTTELVGEATRFGPATVQRVMEEFRADPMTDFQVPHAELGCYSAILSHVYRMFRANWPIKRADSINPFPEGFWSLGGSQKRCCTYLENGFVSRKTDCRFGFFQRKHTLEYG
jgi:hypothetical protein